jgi:hypothetical protein
MNEHIVNYVNHLYSASEGNPIKLAVLLNKDILSSNNYALTLMSSKKLTVDSILFVAETIVNQVNKENSNTKN